MPLCASSHRIHRFVSRTDFVVFDDATNGVMFICGFVWIFTRLYNTSAPKPYFRWMHRERSAQKNPLPKYVEREKKGQRGSEE